MTLRLSTEHSLFSLALIHRAESNQSSSLSSTENITVGNSSVGNNSIVNATMASNSSGNITLTNVTLANNSSGNITLTDVTLANNSSGNITITNIAAEQNSPTDALNVTEFNKNASNATLNEAESPPCQETLEIRRRAFVIMFKLSYSDNSEQWSYYHEGGKVKVCLFILHAICTRFCEPRTRLTCRLTLQIYHLLYQCEHRGNSAALIAARHFATLGRFVSERRRCFSHKYSVMMTSVYSESISLSGQKH